MVQAFSDEITVVYSPAFGDVREFKLSLNDLKTVLARDVTVYDVLNASNMPFPHNLKVDLNANDGAIGIWGKSVATDTPVQDGDRIEIYRPLQFDPKDARRLRYEKQGPVQSRHRPSYKGP